jgi:hypothetical protein
MDASARSRAGWTPERRARHAEKIRQWKPWERSTGPRTAAGKAVSSRNAVMSENRAKLAVILAEVEKNFRLYDRIQREIARDQRRVEEAAARAQARQLRERSHGTCSTKSAQADSPADLYVRMLSARR